MARAEVGYAEGLSTAEGAPQLSLWAAPCGPGPAPLGTSARSAPISQPDSGTQCTLLGDARSPPHGSHHPRATEHLLPLPPVLDLPKQLRLPGCLLPAVCLSVGLSLRLRKLQEASFLPPPLLAATHARPAACCPPTATRGRVPPACAPLGTAWQCSHTSALGPRPGAGAG